MYKCICHHKNKKSTKIGVKIICQVIISRFISTVDIIMVCINKPNLIWLHHHPSIYQIWLYHQFPN